jgi:hypothetical protein
MKRRHFLLLSAILAWTMSLAIFVSPATMLNDTLPNANPLAELLVRMIASIVFCVGLVNFSARRDAWSDSMKAILLGNATLHLLMIALNAYGYVNGLVGTRSVVLSLIVHGALMAGFIVALTRPSRQDDLEMSTAK